MGSLQLKSVVKNFGAIKVLHDVCLEVRDGEFVVFVGPSGCGKSTLLRTIAGLEDTTSGDILIDGNRVNDLPPARRGIAMVFQTYALYPHMTVRKNMTAGLRQARTPKSVIEAQLASAAKMLALEPYLDRLPAQLSGGQRQRVAIGRAIVRNPSLFLFDEPLSNLDAALRVNTRLEIASLHRKLEATMIYVTHDQVEAMTLADRIVVMNGGRIEQIGTPLDLYRTPASRFVAGFIGSPQMNFLEAHLFGENGATVGVRPEHLTLSESEGDISGVVSHVEHLGSDTNVYVTTDDGIQITTRLFGFAEYAPGVRVFASADPAHRHRFDAAGSRVE